MAHPHSKALRVWHSLAAVLLIVAGCAWRAQGQGCGTGTQLDPESNLCVATGGAERTRREADPSLATDDGNLEISISDGKTVSVKVGQEEPHFVSTVTPGSVVEALKLGYQLGQAASKDDLGAMSCSAKVAEEVGNISDRVGVLEGDKSAIATLVGDVKDVQGRLTKVERSVIDVASKAYCDGKLDTATTDLLEKIAALKATQDASATCAKTGQFYEGGKCTEAANSPSVVPLDGCNEETVGAVRYDGKASKLLVCVLNDEKYSFVATSGGGAGELGQSEGNAATSCQALQNAGQKKSGVYWLESIGRVFCMMTDLDKYEGGGWALILDNTDPSNFYMLTNRNNGGRNWEYCKRTHGNKAVSPLGEPDTIKHCAHPLLDKIMPKAKQIMYTDKAYAPFLAATFPDGGGVYWQQIIRQTTSSGRIRVRYFKSGAKGGGSSFFTSADRWIEACAPYPWGHRQDKTHVNYGAISGSCAHICWEDVNDCCKDRPFAMHHCGGANLAYCPVYDRDSNWYGTRGGRRGGDMAVRKFVRW